MDVSVLAGAVLVCVLGGVIPWINTEVAVIGAALLVPRSALPVLVIACALGQMSAKAALYGVTRWAPHRLPARARAFLERAEKYRDRRRLLAVAIFSGAFIAVPPFYIVTLACGLLRVPFLLFLIAGIAGTALRYGFVASAALAFAAP
jgi:membrane protein YqaA with SNARE-associated domain